MIIPQAQEAIKFYELAIKNIQYRLEFDVNRDKKYQTFERKYKKLNYTTLFYGHTHSFSFYKWEGTKTIVFFNIEDKKIIYDKNNTFDGVEDVANELLEIVKKYY
ncbi:MAG: hypothetical protein J7L21_04585 [Sulfurimonas sp.]|nr:hypothetical protein [Sulfurimonas sp.]